MSKTPEERVRNTDAVVKFLRDFIDCTNDAKWIKISIIKEDGKQAEMSYREAFVGTFPTEKLINKIMDSRSQNLSIDWEWKHTSKTVFYSVSFKHIVKLMEDGTRNIIKMSHFKK